MDTYVDGAGKSYTAAQAEQEYRKQLIVAGRALEGDEYDRGLEDWLGTYRKMSKRDKRSISAAATVMAIGIGVTGVIAFLALIIGGGLIAFVVILLVGGVMSFGLGGLVIIFTSTKPD